MSKVKRKQPTHRIYAVDRRNRRQACWMDIGTALAHRDGKGFDLELHTMPLSATRLVARTSAEKRLANGSIMRMARQRRILSRNTASARTGTSKVTTIAEACL